MPEEEAVYQERPGGARRVLRAQGRYFGLPAFLISARRTLIALGVEPSISAISFCPKPVLLSIVTCSLCPRLLSDTNNIPLSVLCNVDESSAIHILQAPFH